MSLFVAVLFIVVLWMAYMAKSPKPHHRMKRPQPLGARPGRIEDDIKKALTTEQLAEIGAISLKFNQIESLVEFILVVILDVPPLLLNAVINAGLPAQRAIERR